MTGDDLPLELLRRFATSGPRYTSYPTADRFDERFGAADYARALRQRAAEAAAGRAAPLSLYVHVPFCESVCFYCACNKVVTRHHERAAPYLESLRREIALHVELLGRGSAVSQLHLGGGTPTFLSDDELASLLAMLREVFRIVPGAEMALEVDPRTADARRLGRWAELGFNRLSLGVQDFDPQVQRAVHRIQGRELVERLMDDARALRFESINLDLILGLPEQTEASFAATIAEVLRLRPDRLALYTYAHLPQRFKPQRRIDAARLPAVPERLAMYAHAVHELVDAGYVHIGMDHFALPGDALAVAQREGRLQRNFQGYSTQPDCDIVALGVSAIGRIGNSYSQNSRALADYGQAMAEGRFAVVRGWTLDADDRLRRELIMGLMCRGEVDLAALERTHGAKDLQALFAPQWQRLQPLQEAGFVELAPSTLRITARGRYVVRAVAMLFDRYLQDAGTAPATATYSRIA